MTFQVTIEAICDGGCDGEWFETITREYTVVLPVGPIKDKLRQQGCLPVPADPQGHKSQGPHHQRLPAAQVRRIRVPAGGDRGVAGRGGRC
jgi:hypothetical protein